MKRLPALLIICLIVLLGFCVYFNSFGNKFLYDDITLIVRNPIIRDFNNISALFTHPVREGAKFYRPLQGLTYMADCFLGGLNPLGYHITNTLLHTTVCVLLFYFILLVTANRLLSAAVSILYLVHPIHTEAVTYVSGRADSLSAIFLLLMLIFQFKYWASSGRTGKIIYYALILVSFMLALLSKELAVVFPVLLMFAEYCLRDKERYESLFWKKFIFYLPLMAIILLWYPLKNAIAPAGALTNDPNVLKLATRLILVPRLIFDYVRLSFLPLGLHMEYKLAFPRSIFQSEYFGPFFFMLLSLPVLYYIWKKGKTDINHRIIFFGAGWFFLALLPCLGIFFPLIVAFSEHWVYIPEMGLLLAVVYSFFYYGKRIKTLGMAAALLFIVAVSAFSFLTIRQNTVWKDDFTFYTYTLRYAPYSARVCDNLASIYMERKDYRKAKELLETALKTAPGWENALQKLKVVNSKLDK